IDNIRKEKLVVTDRKTEGVLLTFLPVMDTDEFGDEVVELLKLHLVNRTPVAYAFNYQLQYFGEKEFELKNTIQPWQDFYLHDVPFEDLNDSPSYHFDFSLTQPDKRKADHYEVMVKIKPKQFFMKVEEIRKANQASFSHKLLDEYPDK